MSNQNSIQKEGKEKRDYLNKSLDKSLDILNLFDAKNSELSVTEIAEKCDTNPSSLYPILHTLEKHGYLTRDSNKRYKLGLSFVEKGRLVLNRLDITSTAKPELEKLRDKAEKTVHLGYLKEDEVVYLDKVESTSGLRMYSSPGKTAPLHSTALGKALLANMPAEQMENIIDNLALTPKTEKTITDKGKLRAEIKKVKEQGYSLDNEEFEEGIKCIGAPVFDHDGGAEAAISITGLASQMGDDVLERYAILIKRYAANISSKLGFEPK